MSQSPSPSAEERAAWQKRLAAQANNRAWDLSEQPARTAQEDQEMLHAAHGAMFFWSIVGNEGNKQHAAQLLAHVYALLDKADEATTYSKAPGDYFLSSEREPWEQALGHAVAANVAAANGEAERHAHHYQRARELVATLADEEERSILNATMRVVPSPPSA